MPGCFGLFFFAYTSCSLNWSDRQLCVPRLNVLFVFVNVLISGFFLSVGLLDGPLNCRAEKFHLGVFFETSLSLSVPLHIFYQLTSFNSFLHFNVVVVVILIFAVVVSLGFFHQTATGLSSAGHFCGVHLVALFSFVLSVGGALLARKCDNIWCRSTDACVQTCNPRYNLVLLLATLVWFHACSCGAFVVRHWTDMATRRNNTATLLLQILSYTFVTLVSVYVANLPK